MFLLFRNSREHQSHGHERPFLEYVRDQNETAFRAGYDLPLMSDHGLRLLGNSDRRQSGRLAG